MAGATQEVCLRGGSHPGFGFVFQRPKGKWDGCPMVQFGCSGGPGSRVSFPNVHTKSWSHVFVSEAGCVRYEPRRDKDGTWVAAKQQMMARVRVVLEDGSSKLKAHAFPILDVPRDGSCADDVFEGQVAQATAAAVEWMNSVQGGG